MIATIEMTSTAIANPLFGPMPSGCTATIRGPPGGVGLKSNEGVSTNRLSPMALTRWAT